MRAPACTHDGDHRRRDLNVAGNHQLRGQSFVVIALLVFAALRGTKRVSSFLLEHSCSLACCMDGGLYLFKEEEKKKGSVCTGDRCMSVSSSSVLSACYITIVRYLLFNWKPIVQLIVG